MINYPVTEKEYFLRMTHHDDFSHILPNLKTKKIKFKAVFFTLNHDNNLLVQKWDRVKPPIENIYRQSLVKITH